MHQNNAVGAKKYRYMFFLVLIFGAEGAEIFFLWFSDLFLWFFGIFRYSYGFLFLWFFSMKSHPGPYAAPTLPDRLSRQVTPAFSFRDSATE